MAISQMQKVTLIAPKKLLEPLMKSVQKMEHIQVNNLSDNNDEQDVVIRYDGTEEVEMTNEEALSYLMSRKQRVERAIAQYTPYLPKQSFWEKVRLETPKVTFEQLEMHGKTFNETAIVEQANRDTQLLIQLDEESQQLQKEYDQLLKWKTLTVIPKQLETLSFVKAIVGTIPNTKEDIGIKFIQKHSDLEYDEIFMNEEEYGIVVFFHGENRHALMEELESFQFKKFDYEYEVLPQERLNQLEQSMAQYATQRQEVIEAMKQTQEVLRDLQVQYDYLVNLQEREATKLLAGRTQHLVAIEGWIEVESVSQFIQSLRQQFQDELVIRVDNVKAEEIPDIPVKLKNHPLVEPFELITEMYALPKYDEIDPTPFVMPFYFTFFGMMVADVGYGLLAVIATFIALKWFKPAESMAKNLRLFHLIGWSTVIWGFIYGSFMGFALPFKLVDPVQESITVLAISIVFGFIQVIVGLLLNTHLKVKHKEYATAYTSGLAWVLILGGFVLMLVANFVPTLSILGTIGKWLAILNAISIVIVSVIEAKGIVGLGSGLYNLYGASSYVGDLVSYSRLMALGISGGSIAVAFNTIIGVLPPVAKFTAGIALFIALHGLNIFLSYLGAYVHGARLMFVEFFGKFYEGGGKPFKPLKLQSKYTTITQQLEEK